LIEITDYRIMLPSNQ